MSLCFALANHFRTQKKARKSLHANLHEKDERVREINLSGISELYILTQNVGCVTGKRHSTIYTLLKAHTQQVQLTSGKLD